MRRIVYSVTLALLLIAALAITVYSQRAGATEEQVKVLIGGVSQRLPMDLTIVVPSESGPQTVTVPIVLSLNLTVGPMNAVDMNIQAEQADQFVSPLHVVEPVSPSETVTTGATTAD